jgi:receptor protein-tyrosine kinase
MNGPPSSLRTERGSHGVASVIPGADRSIGAILVDQGIISLEEAERALALQKAEGLRFGEAAVRLGLLTEAELRAALSNQYSYSYLPLTGNKPLSEELVAAYQPFSGLVEQLRSIRSQLLLRWFNRETGRSILSIVSPERGEGRSYFAANIAVVFSQLGERTLLIDADLRAPRQHELFRLENKVGLSSMLAGRADDEAIVPIRCLANLDVLPSGPVPPNPQELLNRPAFGDLLAGACARYEIILVDTPAFSSGADANMLAARAGGALMVARSRETRVAGLVEMSKVLGQAGVTVVGSVFNDVPAEKV